MVQLAGTYQITYITQDGAKFGNFAGVSIGTDGIVTALFDNGVRKPVFQIPVATFVNPNGLEARTGNTYIETDTSGSYTLRTAGEAGSGQVASASLEASTVDLGEEFTSMIITQRAYSAAAKIITTSDQMLDELVNIKR
jgi:flagellar hook protein FlgE